MEKTKMTGASVVPNTPNEIRPTKWLSETAGSIQESGLISQLPSKQDPVGLARRMEALKDVAYDKGYYRTSALTQFLLCAEFCAVPLLAFVLLTHGGLLAVLGLILFAIHLPRAAFLAHDLTHHQWGSLKTVRSRLMLGAIAFGQGIGTSWWVEKHTRHHSFPNGCRIREDGVRVPVDGDIDVVPWILWDKSLAEYYATAPKSTWENAVSLILPRFQVALFIPLLFLTRFGWARESIEFALRKRKILEASLCVAHWVFGLALAVLLTPGPAWTGWAWFFSAQILGGFFLAIAFVLNHSGMDVYELSASAGFYDRQARSTRNTPSSRFLDWATGGLNSQIEHHMFPKMSRGNLWKMRKATREAMIESGYAYEVLSNGEALRAVFSVLRETADVSNP